jgi:hypothetical protein
MMTRSLATGVIVVSIVLAFGVGAAGATPGGVDAASGAFGGADAASGSIAGVDAASGTIDSGADTAAGDNVTAANADRTLGTTSPDPGETVGVTTTFQLDSQDNVSYVDEFSPEFASSTLVSVTADGTEISPSFQIIGPDTVLVVLNEVGPAQIQINYEVTVPSDATPGTVYNLDPTLELDDGKVPVSGPTQMTVPGDSPNFDVTIDSIDDEVQAGETVSADGTVTNSGDGSGSQSIGFSVDGTEVANESIALDPGGSQTVSFSYETTGDDVPEIDVAVASENDTASSTVTVIGDATFEVGIDSIDDEVIAGEDVSVDATVTNTGDVTETQPITFSVDGTEQDSETVELDSGESQAVSFSYGTTADDVPEIDVEVASENDTASSTVSVLEPASFEVGIDSIPEEVTAGQEVSVAATVTNTGDENGSQSIGFSVDGTEQGSETVELDGGESQSVSFSYETTGDDVPEIDVEVASDDDTASSTVTVLEAPGPPTFEVAVDSIDDEVIAGEEVQVAATITNTGDESGSQSIGFSVDGTEQGSETVELDGGESQSVSFSYGTSVGDVPSIEVAVASENDTASSTVTVLEPATFEVELGDVDGEVTAGDDLSVAATVTNSGDLSGSQSIGFSVDGTEQASETIELDGGESEGVSFSYATSAGDVPEVDVAVASENDTASTTVTVVGQFEVEIDEIDEDVDAGESVSVTATITNTAAESGSQPISFSVDGTEQGSETVELDSGESQSVSFSYATVEEDTPEILVTVASEDDTAERRVTVVGDVEVAVDEVDEEVVAGEEVSVTATVTNTGEETADQSIAFTVDRAEVDVESVSLAPDESQEVSFSYGTTGDDVPEIGVAVASEDDIERRTVTVLQRATFEVAIDEVDEEVVAGDEVTVEYTVQNTGDLEGTQQLVFSVDGTQEDAETVTIGGDGSFENSFSYGTTEDDVPAIDVAVASDNDTDARTLDVVAPGALVVSSVEPAGPVTAGNALDVAVTVENGGGTEATGSVTLVVENEAGDVLDSIESTVTVASGGTETVTMTYDTATSDPPSVFVRAETESDSSDRVAATVQQQSGTATFAVRIEDVDAEVTAGGTVTVDYTVENVGDTEATKEITVSVDGDPIDSTDVTLGGGDTTTLSAEYRTTPDDTPEVEVEVASDDRSAARTVTVAGQSGRTTFEVTVDDDATDDRVDAGDTASVSAIVENTGGAAGTREVRLSIDGVTRDRTSVTLGGGESRTVSLSYRTADDDAPEVSFQVVAGGSVSGGTIAVDSSTDGDTTPADDDSGPGFGLVAILVSLLVLALGGRYLSE